jgi:drug/metabolite transporter, DME family
MVSRVIKFLSGPGLVAAAAFLWATDALVRYPAIGRVDPTFIVFVEHLLAVLILLPWVMLKFPGKIFSLSFKEWVAALFCGVGGSALGTVLFTASFAYVNPSVAVLLQKLQPVFVVMIAYVLLGERPVRKFYFWAVIALAAGIVLGFPELQFKELFHSISLRSKGIHYAFAAALIWAASTVSSKILLRRLPVVLATFWRFSFGFIALGLLFGIVQGPGLWHYCKIGMEYSNFVPLLYLSLVPGLFAMMAYYSGLSRTPAGVTSFIELIYPIAAVVLNTVFLHTPLEPIQTIAGGVLILAVAMISF